MERDKLMQDIERTLFGPRVRIGMDELEKARAAMSKLFLPEVEFETKVSAFESLPKAYVYMTGDQDVNGAFRPQNVPRGLRTCADFSASSFAYALQNALSMYLSKAFKRFPYHEEVLISDKRKAKDFRTIHSVQLGYFEELPEVDPEAADYESLKTFDDTESEYDLAHKGGILWVTRRLIMNDSIDVIKGMTNRMARAARMTHAKYVWAFFIDNALCPDGTAWFTLGHGNLGTSALDIDPLVTAITALANMTEPGASGEKIGLDLASFKWHLVIPIDLWDLAVKKNQTDSVFSSNDLTDKVPNPCRRLFGTQNERIVVCPFMTDANDWGVIRSPEEVPIVEMSYYAGNEDPEFILEVGPTDEHVLRADKLGYKIRHEYGGALAGYRGGYKSTVA